MKEKLNTVVVGAGIGGLGAALALSRAGHAVTIIERDDTPMPSDVEGAFDWDRRGVPQTCHPHAFLGLARKILRDGYPDVIEALTVAGVKDVGISDTPRMVLDEKVREVLAADDDLRMLACRRTTFEWVLRRIVTAEPHVSLRVGQPVTGVTHEAGEGGLPRVTGVVLKDGSTVPSDLVVVSSGRSGALQGWFASMGAELPEKSSDAGVVYFSRFYRRESDKPIGFQGGFGAGVIAGTVGGDAGTYSITAVVDKDDKELRNHLKDDDRFDATMRLFPELDHIVNAGGVPIKPVHCVTGLINRSRRFTTNDGTPRVIGLVASGDVHTCTNPAYGRGMSLALLQATMMVDAIDKADNLLDVGRRYEADCRARVAPWYQFSVMTDTARSAGTGSNRPDAVSRSVGGEGDVLSMMGNAVKDPEMIHAFLRTMNCLGHPSDLFKHIGKLSTLPRPTSSKPKPSGARKRSRRPSREELLAVAP